MSDWAIKVEGLGKRYRVGERLSYLRMTEAVERVLTAPLDAARRLVKRRGVSETLAESKRAFWALREVSFEVARGEVLGVIGRNGAGKSTLLKLIARITEPTEGEVRLRGRVASLLEVGTGFHPELTGRENVYLNGTILGMTRREVKSKFDEIVAFSGVERFLDTPVKRYSSGMRVRLAFAVAAHLEPEVLLIDEVLAVGDAEFQRRCLGKMQDVARGGRTVLFVSHNMGAVRQLCGSCLMLESGNNVHHGDTEEVCRDYLDRHSAQSRDAIVSQLAAIPKDRDVELLDVGVGQRGRPTLEPLSGEPVEVQVSFRVLRRVERLRVYFDLTDELGALLIRSFHDDAASRPSLFEPGTYHYVGRIPKDLLGPRRYRLTVRAGIHNERSCWGDGVSAELSVARTHAVNVAYAGDPVRSALLPRVEWSQHREYSMAESC